MPHIQILPHFVYILPASMAWSSYNSNAIHYVNFWFCEWWCHAFT